ncbi:GNAT family N-acetyltransferase [Vibrio campbellii]|uniref:GNAT family N-acetyltransferase n=1 Tax=Vibrio campbellii TaxID=680 RepID=UPI00215C77A7|nr:GNAT family N-acetyltransferase [Vibrio campbellii]MCR9905926.1 GNAT family N-acetyltransferase [Vibrio campbellii]
MEITFRQINMDDDFELCVASRKDAYFCSFGHYDGFEDFISGYREQILERLSTSGWFYIHIFVDGEFAGQLEFRSFSPEPDTGYVHLIYLKPNFRGLGLAPKVQEYIVRTLSQAGCLRAVLSVSRTNTRALTFYKRNGWEFARRNPKHDETDFYQLWVGHTGYVESGSSRLSGVKR